MLEDEGWLAVNRKTRQIQSAGGVQANNEYLILIPKKVVQEMHHLLSKVVQNDPKGGSPGAPKVVHRAHSNNNSNNNINNNNTDSSIKMDIEKPKPKEKPQEGWENTKEGVFLMANYLGMNWVSNETMDAFKARILKAASRYANL